MAAADDLHRLAAEIHDVPRVALIGVALEAKKIARVQGKRAGGPLKGKKRRGLPLIARYKDPEMTATGATCRIQGVSPAGWVWATTGTDPHAIRRRKRGPMKVMTVPHPGTTGKGAWFQVVAAVEKSMPTIVRREVIRIVSRFS